MQFTFLPTLVMRNPILSYQDYNAFDGNQLLQSDFFRSALFIANADFYNELEKHGFDYQRLSSKQKNTIRNYYNRACFRSTPFGVFSSITPVAWSNEHDQIQFGNEKFTTHFKPDYLLNLKLCNDLLANEAWDTVKYKSNITLYKVHKQFRYIKYGIELNNTKRSFSIISLSNNKMIAEISKFCAIERSFNDIVQYLMESTGYDEETMTQFARQLITEQIILPQQGANITGNSCLEDLLEYLHQHNVNSPRLNVISALMEELRAINVHDIGQVTKYSQLLEELLEGGEKYKSVFYVVAERENGEGGLQAKYQQMVLDGLQCLNALAPFHRNEELEDFKHAFIEKFEEREISLLAALDPEIGIGYENKDDVIYWEDELLKDINFNNSHAESRKHVKWTTTHSLLLNKFHSQKNGLNRIELTEADLKEIKVHSEEYKLPPSMSVVFRLHNDQVYIENAGGVSATSIIGRFTSINDQVFSMAREIAAKEQECNTEVLFAEIAHIGDMRAANINSRKHIRQYEVAVMATSTVGEKFQLALHDIFVSVRNGQIILRSKKHNAIIVPRHSSAFNHHNSELSVFRFLCDLQFQGLKTNLTLDLSHFFPDLKFYPRVVYKSAILTLATWHLNGNDLTFIKNEARSDWQTRFHRLAQSIQLPRFFALTQHDNQLVFDQENEEDILLFLDTIRNYDKVMLTEFLINNEGVPDVVDHRGRPLIGQYIASLYQNEPVYNFPVYHAFKGNEHTSRSFTPGTEWLYFKIYCHPVLANELLREVLWPLLEKFYKSKAVDKWFFVRYYDPNHHIRLRVHMNELLSDKLIAIFSKKLRTLVEKRKIEKYYLDTYIRELERYAPASIVDIESFFFGSSQLIVHYINQSVQDGKPYPYNLDIIIISIEEILNAFKLTAQQRISLFQSLYTGFYQEFGEEESLKKSLEKKYNTLRNEINGIYEKMNTLKAGLDHDYKELYKYSEKIAGSVSNTYAVKEKLLEGLIHMHLNRLFVQKARKQELIIYYLLYKHYNSIYYRGQLAR
ncbi:lantibiotic dehydratase [Niastella sp. OAS944]|uniref:lantibiotic dehydratase n=1 Tax=Niastella sp. OAS944 TaxID=2664089 RepID=UPI0034823D2A|nr:thiopeptide-type bacteriocin biosynthesis protein [Chitinophagaceae bacterium OAS944]